MRFESMITPPDWVTGQEGYWLLVGRNTVLVRRGDNGPEFPRARDPRDLGLAAEVPQFLGLLEGEPVWAAGIDADGDGQPDELQPESLFGLFPHVHEAVWALAGRAVQIAEWQRTHRFCGRCGTPTEIAPGERATKCPACNLLSFPRIAPAVITAVTRDDEILLARGRQFGAPMYSVLAGFVEPGETLEETVFREVKEGASIVFESTDR
jgi:NAD+ diphosphatase